ncbi:alpha-hydroxyacid dehydrogenase, FMN-dependent L-lactate dehydrogenase [Opitutaceae bacterium TAV1]|nr:alpha-hydroxyacid dehydrogenase, FMN-dependent L-lactate dehydrogenase [Opitutaceae bacterium TAV1]
MLPPLTRIPPDVVALADYERLARERIAPDAREWLEGGSADGITLRENRAAFDRLQLRGRVLADFNAPPPASAANAAAADAIAHPTRVKLPGGTTLALPVLVAPMALHRVVHPEGERATVLGALAAGAGMVVSTQASVSLEEIAAVAAQAQPDTPAGAASVADSPLWFQLYLHPDRGATRALVQRAEAAGYRALVVTVDAPVEGVRNRERRAQFRPPPGVEAVNLRGAPAPSASLPPLPRSPLCGGLMGVAPTWADIERLRGDTRLPVILKGITDPEDAAEALALGADGLIVSNHGGRTLDTLPATIDALPAVADVIGGRIPLLLDGGVRRGTDIVKALALGARAVLVGRPVLHALAAAGAPGVAHVLRILQAELEIALALTGRPSVSHVDRSVLRPQARGRAGG